MLLNVPTLKIQFYYTGTFRYHTYDCMFVEQVDQMNKIELHLEKPLGQKTSDCDLGCRMLSMGRWLGLLVELNYGFRFGLIVGLRWFKRNRNFDVCAFNILGRKTSKVFFLVKKPYHKAWCWFNTWWWWCSGSSIKWTWFIITCSAISMRSWFIFNSLLKINTWATFSNSLGSNTWTWTGTWKVWVWDRGDDAACKIWISDQAWSDGVQILPVDL